jgi:hypothetical protein
MNYKCVNPMCGRIETNKKNLRIKKSGYPDEKLDIVCGLCGGEIRLVPGEMN